jgi:hypothetical protein
MRIMVIVASAAMAASCGSAAISPKGDASGSGGLSGTAGSRGDASAGSSGGASAGSSGDASAGSSGGASAGSAGGSGGGAGATGGSAGGSSTDAGSGAPDAASDGAPDSSTDLAGAPSDATDSAPAPVVCDIATPFGAPREVPELNHATLGQSDATLTDDELTVYFTRQVAGANFDIYVATRSSRTATFGTPTRVDEVSTGADDRGAMISPNGLRLYFHSSRDGGYEIWSASRPDLQSVFGAPTKVAGVNSSTAVDGDPWIVADGQSLYFGSDRDAPGGIYRSKLGPAGFQAPTRVTELGDSAAAVLSSDETVIYFGSARSGVVANDADIWMARRTTVNDGFGAPVRVSELSTPTLFEYPTWLSRDRCRMYFMRGYRIMFAERSP